MEKTISDAVSMLKGMVAIPSVSFDEGKVCRYISEVLESRGIMHHMIKNNIVAAGQGFDPEKKTLMLCAHMDTVPPNSEYSFDPYRPDYACAEKVLGHAENESYADSAATTMEGQWCQCAPHSDISWRKSFHSTLCLF